MSTHVLNAESNQVVRSAEGARSALQREDLTVAERMLTEAQDRIGRLLREIGDKHRDGLIVPKPDEGDNVLSKALITEDASQGRRCGLVGLDQEGRDASPARDSLRLLPPQHAYARGLATDRP